MQPIEFLGGKYQESEQVWPGPVQTFRAHESSTRRPVFVHRVSTTDEPAQQIALLRLLSTALLQSATARKLVLEVSDEAGFWYVVTEGEPQCLLLREWLQFEIDHALAQPQASGKRDAASPKVEAPNAPQAASSESLAAAPVQTSAKEVENPKPTSAQQEGPGEFTRFFQGGLPPPKKAAQPEAARRQDRPSNPSMLKRSTDRPSKIGGFVQRPNTPVPSNLPQRPSEPREPGEFTRIFSRTTNEAAGSPPGGFSGTADLGAANQVSANLPDAGNRKTNIPDLFSTTPEVPKANPSPSKEPGEYTRIFGKDNIPPPAQQSSSLANPRPQSFDDPLMTARPAAAPGPPASSPKGPSEYTRVMQGGSAQDGSNAGGAEVLGGPPAGAAPGSAPPKLNIPAVPMQGLASLAQASMKAPQIPNAGAAGSMPKPQLPSQIPAALPSIAAAASSASNKKLLIFFSILGVLAVLLIILTVMALKK